ncbi:MAG TPA: response regulator transcription factor [Dehalococcoidia bacterium]|nr:response regulator transcription factor [Dehalococcoidia bacterium]
MHVLVVDDDERVRNVMRRALRLEGHRVSEAADGEAALRNLREADPDLVILDLRLPGIDGIEVCKRLRSVSEVPVLMLTARDTVPDRVQGLDSGADDYVVKPFDLDELLARVRAFGRRARAEQPAALRFAGLTLDPGTREAWRGERKLALTPREFDLLELFLRHPRQALTRELISDRVWGYECDFESNVIDVCIKYLREKLEAGAELRLIQTVRGIGYALREEP